MKEGLKLAICFWWSLRLLLPSGGAGAGMQLGHTSDAELAGFPRGCHLAPVRSTGLPYPQQQHRGNQSFI